MDDAALYSLMRPHKVCVCRQVSETEIREAVSVKGARDFEQVQSLTGAGTGCGTCEGSVRHIIETEIASMTSAE